jgi:hypothetical protein
MSFEVFCGRVAHLSAAIELLNNQLPPVRCVVVFPVVVFPVVITLQT